MRSSRGDRVMPIIILLFGIAVVLYSLCPDVLIDLCLLIVWSFLSFILAHLIIAGITRIRTKWNLRKNKEKKE